MIYEELRPGKKNAITSKDIMKRLRIDERTLRRLVAEEREAGALICSCKQGYYIPETLEELEHTRNRFKSFENSSREMVRVIDGMIAAWKRNQEEPATGHQMTIDDYLEGDPN